MGRRDDLTNLFKRWAYDEDQTVRRIRGADGREMLQVRLPLGIEQYELSGRPDGLRPEGHESWLQCYEKKARANLDKGFILNQKDCKHLQNEGMLYYYRYLLFFQAGDYTLCVRDTARNLRLLDFVSRHAASREFSEGLEQYRPYIVRMNIMARTLHMIQKGGSFRTAIRKLERGIETIQDLPDIENNVIFGFEKERSIKCLDELIRQLRSQLPVSKRDTLTKKMEDAIAREDYEQAAVFRDRLKGSSKTPPSAQRRGKGRQSRSADEAI